MTARRGISLIEIMISISLLAVVVSSLGALSLQVARGSFGISGGAYRNGVLAEQLNRLLVLPFDSLGLAKYQGCTTVAAGPLPHTRCVTVTGVSPTQRAVRLVVTPANKLFRPDTLYFERTRVPARSPLQ